MSRSNDIAGLTTSILDGVTAAEVGLGNVNNTSDANKPVSTAQQSAIDLKANIASPTFTGTITVPNDSISGDAISGGSPSFASISVADAISILGTAGRFLKSTTDGGLAQIHTKRGYTTSTGAVNIYTPPQYELGIVSAFQNIDSTAQACSLYSAEYPGQYALRLVNLGSSGISIDHSGSATIKVNSNSAFNWVIISMHSKT